MRAALAIALFVLAFTPRVARAQLHWDASLLAGAADRILVDDVGEQPTPGLAVGLKAHVAVLPLIRAGGYLSYDISPLGDDPPRQFASGGLEARVLAPWIHTPFRLWLYLGAGYGRVFAPSGTRTVASGAPTAEALTVSIPPSNGGFVEIPLGIGASYMFRKPWAVTAELGGRFGFGFHGSAYETQSGSVGGSGGVPVAPNGDDVFAVCLMVGIAIDK